MFALAFMAVATRVLIIQRRQRQSEERLHLDVAERKRTEEALRESEVEYRLLFDSSPIPMWVFDVETLVSAANEATIPTLRFEEGFLQMTIQIQARGRHPHPVGSHPKLTDGLRSGERWRRHRKKDGAVIEVEIVSHYLNFHGIEAELVAAHDITERKRYRRCCRISEIQVSRVVRGLRRRNLADG